MQHLDRTVTKTFQTVKQKITKTRTHSNSVIPLQNCIRDFSTAVLMCPVYRLLYIFEHNNTFNAH